MRKIKIWLLNLIKKGDKVMRSDKKVVEDYLIDKNVEQNLLNMANFFVTKYGREWLKIGYIEKTQKIFQSRQEIVEILNLLVLKGYAVSKVKEGKQMYRITMTSKEQIKVYEDMLNDIDLERTKICAKIADLKKGLSR